LSELNTTPLHPLHVELGARMTPFAGYDMPLQYPLGLMKEHIHTRSGAGLFDVSHMGQVIVRPKSGDVNDAATALEKLVPVDVAGLKVGRQRYALFTNDSGGIEDDLMVANRWDHLFLVVNAACKAVEPVGLGARDSLRLEAGLCLYGNDINTGTTPVSASLEWAIQKSRRKGGAREGGFPGADIILAELENGAKMRRVGLRAEGRAPVRADTQLFESEDASEAVGHVTSGVFGPTIGAPVAMGYVPAALSAPETRLFAEVRGKRLPVRVSEMPFRPPTYKR